MAVASTYNSQHPSPCNSTNSKPFCESNKPFAFTFPSLLFPPPPTQMGSIEDYSSSLSTKVLVGVSLDARVSSELLSWAVEVAARPNDTIVAVHVIVGKEENRLNYDLNRFRRAKAFVISMLGDFADICETKQVKLEAKVRRSVGVGRGLTDEASLLHANFLIVGGSRSCSNSQRNIFEITNYCFKHAPKTCWVIAIRKQNSCAYDTEELESVTYEGKSRSRWSKRLLGGSMGKKEKRQSPEEAESISDRSSSQVAVLEECFSPMTKETGGHSRRNTWRSLSIVKFLFPFSPRSESEDLREIDEEEKPSWRCLGYDEISNATRNFHPENMVGRGGYAEVFKGKLYNGQSVAVKRLMKGHRKDDNKEMEFLTELGIVGHVCHPNTSFLIGCCIDNGLHLVFEFSPNGTLASALHGRNSKLLEWHTRYKIAQGIARGLHYLHKCCRRRIIHRDIKASNVLLGPDFEPQISDFGLAKWLPKQWTHHYVNPIEGTFGYLAPEYFMHGIVDEKTDVFAFGVLLLEIVTGRRPIDTSKQSLLLWARPIIESGNIVELVDPRLSDKYNAEQLRRLVTTASYCIRHSSIWRPSMSDVLKLLTDTQSEEVESWRMSVFEDNETDRWADILDCYMPY